MDPMWHLAREWEEMKKRVNRLERDIYWLNKFKDKKEDEERAKSVRKIKP